ncbi:MAG: RDD family protein [Woeseiaceae bacterium]
MFAEFAVRMAAIAVDAFIALFAASALHDHVFPLIGVTYADHRPTVMVFLFVYFAVSWLGPLRATPTQFLFGMRVISETGDKLCIARALLRSALLVALIEATLAVFRPPLEWYVQILGLLAYASLILAIFNRRRQAAHDLLLRSLVVNRKAAMQWRYDAPPELTRPPIISMIGNITFLALPIFVLSTFGGVEYTKNLRSRVAYAYQETRDLRNAVELHHLEFESFPASNAELKTGERTHYPEGGYYELEADGVIRVRFTVLDDLKNGSLTFSPQESEEGIKWRCDREGELQPKFMPAFCRN